MFYASPALFYVFVVTKVTSGSHQLNAELVTLRKTSFYVVTNCLVVS